MHWKLGLESPEMGFRGEKKSVIISPKFRGKF